MITTTVRGPLRAKRGFAAFASFLVMAFAIYLTPVIGQQADSARSDGDDRGKFCSRTAKALFKACGHEVQDDYWVAVAKCHNVSDDKDREECFDEADASREDGNRLCRRQLAGRLDACESLGEDRYDPDFDPKLFDDDFTHLTNPNRYFPLGIGYQWEYHGGTEINILEVLNQTKLIDGVRCIVVRDRVIDDGDLIEDTDDWFAQAKDGNVWYCGEEVKDFESYDGDAPRRPELISIGGSFKAGRNGDKPGIIFRAAPQRGDVYLEEFSLGNAEDITEILSATYAFGSDPELDRFVPERLARLFCAGDCVVTKNYSLLEPGIFARKYYAPGIGVFLEVNLNTRSVVQLRKCNFDPRCALLRTR